MALVGAVWPRIVIVILALFTQVMTRGFQGIALLWPVLGFVFLPTTTLAYALIKVYAGSIDSPWLAALAVAFFNDLGQLGVFRRQSLLTRAPARERFVDPG